MEESSIPQDRSLKEDIELLAALGEAHRKWQCLGADCPDSCCGFRFQEARIFIHEILPLSRYFPLSFNVLNSPGGKPDISLSIFLRAPLGIAPCAYLREGEGCTRGEERPIACKQRPFCVVIDDDGSYNEALKPSCPGFSSQSGQSILMPDGTINPVIYGECIKPATCAAEATEETRTFVDTLVKHDLISVGCCDHRGGKVFLHIVDAKKLCALPQDILNEFRSNGYMDLILAHINSIVHLRRFMDIYLERNA